MLYAEIIISKIKFWFYEKSLSNFLFWSNGKSCFNKKSKYKNTINLNHIYKYNIIFEAKIFILQPNCSLNFMFVEIKFLV